LRSWFLIGSAGLALLIIVRQVITIQEKDRHHRSLHLAYREMEDKNRRALDHTARLERINAELHAEKVNLIKDNENLVESNASWERLATTDTITEVANHRALQERLREEIARAQRYRYRFVLLMLDVDQFKLYNDTHGHQAGDEVLRQIAVAMRAAVREGDFVARYGGEEFAALLPQTSVNDGRIVAERIREAVESKRLEYGDVTLSIGAAEFPVDGDHGVALILSADRALYVAKGQGRNRVIFAQDIA
jgi:diguanylate cyclase (GGDEF)-like protein